ncbi:hypothetical protein BDY19DRAFT_989741 [Irpex rosettiformis]|uniref:Uncharacterized protein n=1 Tax=Irpex rosettiformis TaxID=378272 RepID=A0ACB8UFC5_9APHY|nr:hypothetical protein BDY19DRAFT_989741 [Irpex rosettiformis]
MRAPRLPKRAQTIDDKPFTVSTVLLAAQLDVLVTSQPVLSFKMRFILAALALLPSAFATLKLNQPNAQSYWVQNTSNTINWQFTSGDPSPVDILVVNADNSTLNGPFSIAQFVDTSTMSFTVTNVTLKVGTGFEVQFVSPQNHTQVYATSPNFDVKAPGTAPPPSTTGNGTSTSSGNSTASSVSSAAVSATTSAKRPPPALNNGAMSVFGVQGIFGIVVACAVASVAVLL